MQPPLTESEQRLLLQPGQQVPLFSAPSAQGRDIALWDYKQRRHVALFFLHSATCDRCRTVLYEIRAQRDSYTEQEVGPVVVLKETVAGVQGVAQEVGITFPLLADPDNQHLRRYVALAEGERPPLAVFIADRYSRLWNQTVVQLHDELPSQDKVLEWFQFLNMRCTL